MKAIFVILAASIFALQSCKNDEHKPVETIATAAHIDTICEQAKMRARNDIRVDSIKYYHCSIAEPDSALVASMKQYRVNVIAKGCEPDRNLTCYNQIVDSFINVKRGK